MLRLPKEKIRAGVILAVVFGSGSTPLVSEPLDPLLVAPPVQVGESDELSLQILAAQVARTERRLNDMLEDYRRIEFAQRWADPVAGLRMFDALAAQHVHGPTCNHSYDSPYGAVSLPQIGPDGQEMRQVLDRLADTITRLEMQVAFFERGVARAQAKIQGDGP